MLNRSTIQILTKQCCCGIAGLLCMYGTQAQTTDTLKNVKVSAIKYADVTTATMPVQQLGKDALSKLNSLSVADAVKFFAGVLVKDYGGIGGLKTVSVRSLGASHTGVMYDGVIMPDAQGGQIDLGKLSLDNIESITLYVAQPTDILLPAKTYAYASVLSLKSYIPKFDADKKIHIKAALKAGSFGFVDPAVTVQYNSSKHFYNSISAEYQRADGAYSFKAYEANGGNAKRNNSDINAVRAEYDAGYKINDSNVVKFKTYYYYSDRGLPGAVILYNSFSDDRLIDQNFFAQASWQRSFRSKSNLLLNGKYSANYNYYQDPSFPNTQGKLQNKFHQKEYYLSGAYAYNFSKLFSAAYSSDYFISTLTRSDEFAQGFAVPTRDTWLNNIAAKAIFANVEIQGNLLYTRLHDEVKVGTNGKNIEAFTPTVAVSYQPSKSLPLHIRAFYKNIFRAPTFNDLYYTYVGNTALRPEYARQYNVGFTYKQNSNSFLQTAFVTTDFYYNKVTDKILAVPRQNLFQWTMLNIGTVDIKGIDVATQFYFKEIRKILISSRLNYTYQKSLDKSDPTSPLYNAQIPYTPEHSGSINLNAVYKGFSFSYNVLLSGYRYRIGEPIPDNLVKEWATQDISLSYNISTKNTKYKFLLELNNIFNKQYEIIKYYPMPRFNYRAGVMIEL